MMQTDIDVIESAPPVRSAPIVQLLRGLLFSIDAIAVVRGAGNSK